MANTKTVTILKVKDGEIVRVEKSEYEYYCDKYSKEEVDKWLQEVKMEDLFYCLDTCSNDSFLDWSDKKHRDKALNKMEMILKEDGKNLYPSVTYGTRPNETCYSYIGKITDKKYGNYDIAMFLVREKMSELKEWLLNNHNFTEQEKRLLHYL